ncbi:MAG: nuclear transport factor 2 family protein [Chloroflexota bacterium]
MKYETFIRDFFSAWQKRNWDFVERSITDDFTFTSPYDDHLDKNDYEQKCWNAIKEMEDYNIITIIENGDQAFIRYKGRVNGTQVQNTEHFIFQDGKIKAITVFFGRP